MKIKLTRRRLGAVWAADEDHEQYIRICFAHISDLIWIKGVEIENGDGVGDQGDVRITVEYERQPLVAENVNIRQRINDAVGLRGGLDVVNVEAPPMINKIPGIRQEVGGQGQVLHVVHPILASLVARDDQFRGGLRVGNVERVLLVFQQRPDGQFQYTGGVETTARAGGAAAAAANNPYKRFADTIENNPGVLRMSCIRPGFTGAILEITAAGGSTIETTWKDPSLAPREEPGIRVIERTEVGTKFRISSIFAEWVVRKNEHLRILLNENVERVAFTHFLLPGNRHEYTGDRSISTRVDAVAADNPYRRFAEILEVNPNERELCRDDKLLYIEMLMREDGAVNLSFKQSLESTIVASDGDDQREDQREAGDDAAADAGGGGAGAGEVEDAGAAAAADQDDELPRGGGGGGADEDDDDDAADDVLARGFRAAFM